MAIVNTARAVAEALPNIPLSIATGVAGAAQIAAIQSEPLPALAHGGDILSSGRALVGEEGPEILNLPRGASVQPLTRNSPGNEVNISITGNNINSQLDIDRIGKQMVRKLKRAGVV